MSRPSRLQQAAQALFALQASQGRDFGGWHARLQPRAQHRISQHVRPVMRGLVAMKAQGAVNGARDRIEEGLAGGPLPALIDEQRGFCEAIGPLLQVVLQQLPATRSNGQNPSLGGAGPLHTDASVRDICLLQALELPRVMAVSKSMASMAVLRACSQSPCRRHWARSHCRWEVFSTVEATSARRWISGGMG